MPVISLIATTVINSVKYVYVTKDDTGRYTFPHINMTFYSPVDVNLYVAKLAPPGAICTNLFVYNVTGTGNIQYHIITAEFPYTYAPTYYDLFTYEQVIQCVEWFYLTALNSVFGNEPWVRVHERTSYEFRDATVELTFMIPNGQECRIVLAFLTPKHIYHIRDLSADIQTIWSKYRLGIWTIYSDGSMINTNNDTIYRLQREILSLANKYPGTMQFYQMLPANTESGYSVQVIGYDPQFLNGFVPRLTLKIV